MAGSEGGEAAAAKARAAQRMLAESLAETSPQGLRAASAALGKRFQGGLADMDGYVYLQKLLVQHALNLAEKHPEQAREYKTAAIPMTYNLAANTWPGWGKAEAQAVGEGHRKLGLAAARRNVALAAEVGLGPERRRNGYWILGAHQLAARDHAAAAQSFAGSAALAREAQDAAAALMAQGWVHVARLLDGADETHQLDAVRKELRGLGEDGEFYADQYATALQVFQNSQTNAERAAPVGVSTR